MDATEPRMSGGALPRIASAATIAGAVLVTALAHSPAASMPVTRDASLGVSILAYHRFGPAVSDSMTVRTSTFSWQLQYLKEHRYSIIPLRTVVSYLRGEAPPPPPHSVVITVDDGHESVFTDMWPVVRAYDTPVTLFIYPSAISNASYAMTWSQLQTLRDTGVFDIQSHTYWHPNFAIERRRLTPAAYREFVMMQLSTSKSVLNNRLGIDAVVLSWPFGVYDETLLRTARECGYVAGVTLDRRFVSARDPVMALPRFLVTDAASGARFAAMLPPLERSR